MSILKNKVVRYTVKTGSNVIKTGYELVETARTHALNVVVNHTPDIYDKTDDISTGTTKAAIGNSVMVGRNGARIVRSGINAYHERIVKKLNFTLTELDAKIAEKEKMLESGKDKFGNELTDEKKAKLKKELLDHKKEREILEKNINKENAKIKKDKGFSLKRSTKETIRNQSRKAIASIGRDDSIGNQAISQTALSFWKINKYKRTVVRTVQILKGLITSAISFITSIPGILTAVVTSIPVMIVMICVMVVLACISSELDLSARIINFSTKEVKLENAYRTALLPDEILAISNTLGWSTQDVEDYEILISFAYDQKRGEKPSFEDMMDNVFRKYNPANHFTIGQPVTEGDSHYIYYHNEEGSIGNLGNDKVVRKAITNQQWLNTYPHYQRASNDEKKQWSSEEFIQKLKQDCREALEQNAYNYIASFMQIENKPDVFTHYVVDPGSGTSSVVGYRSISLGEEVDNSFHYGTDIAAPRNTPVYAVMDGVVVYADGEQTVEGSAVGLWGAGNSVIIRKEIIDAKGNQSYIYVMVAHLNTNTVTVHVGDQVYGGTQIGGIGSTGTSTGDHLHFQVWMSKQKVDKITEGNWISVLPSKLDDSVTGKTYTVDDSNYHIILDGTMFYDVEYRNQLYNR